MLPGMDLVDVLTELGGVARRGTLLRLVERDDLDRAVRGGEVVRLNRGIYALLQVDEAQRAVVASGGVLSHASAALAHGWGIKTVPKRPQVTVSRGRQLGAWSAGVDVHRAELRKDQVDDGRTSVDLTLEQCLRSLAFDEALAIADSARREGVGASVLEELALRVRGPGARQVRRVCAEASPLAANPFESVLRAIALDVPGLAVLPQVKVTDGDVTIRSDLVDERLRLVLEADSFEWHGKRQALAADCRRYNKIVVNGWIVLRFPYEDVMFDQPLVRETLTAAVALAELMNEWSRLAKGAA